MRQSVWQVRLFGGLSVGQGAEASGRLSTRQTELLLTILADGLGKPHPRISLIDELWPQVPDEAGRNRLRVALTYLRRAAEPVGIPAGSILVANRSVVSLSASACRVDSVDFGETIEQATRSSDRDRRIELCRRADELYRGPFLEGWDGDWVEGRRAHYARLQSSAQLKLATLLEETGQKEGALRAVRRSIGADPLREAPRRRLLRLLAQSGEVAAALEEYETYRKLLRREIGLAPTAELQAWIHNLKPSGNRDRRTPAPLEPSPPPLQDSAQVAKTETPVFLPPALSNFVGRSAEVAELSELLLVSRCITLTGPGGIGKTRLAVEVARASLEAFGAGVFFVALGENPNPSTILETILGQVELEGSADPLDSLKRFFSQATREGRNACLFILDGFEHLPIAAHRVLTRLLAELPNATALLTSRRSIGFAGEYDFPVHPLPVPSEDEAIESLASNPSVQLFVERAKLVAPQYGLTRSNCETIRSLCRRLEGIPLSLELAAARSKRSSAQVILDQLDDLTSLADSKSWREPRHRSLLASLSSSLNDVPEPQRRALFSLCVFRGGFDIPAAAFVADATHADVELLADHSLLVRHAGGRYQMLDMVREFGWSRLSQQEQRAVSERHAAYFRKLMSEMEALHITSGVQQPGRLRPDTHNIRAAAEWILGNADSETISRFFLASVWLWVINGGLPEGREFVRRAKDLSLSSKLAAARLDLAEGFLAGYHDDPDACFESLTRAVPEIETAGMSRHVALANGELGYVEYLRGNFAEALAAGRRGMETHSSGSIGRWAALDCHLQGMALCELGRLDESLDWHTRSEAICREHGDLLFLSYCNLGHARLAWKTGSLAEAWRIYLETARLFGEWRDIRCLAYSVEGLGRVAVSGARFDIGARLLGAAQRIRDAIGQRRDFVDGRDFALALDAAEGALGAKFETEWQAGYAVSPRSAVAWLEGLDLGL